MTDAGRGEVAAAFKRWRREYLSSEVPITRDRLHQLHEVENAARAFVRARQGDDTLQETAEAIWESYDRLRRALNMEPTDD